MSFFSSPFLQIRSSGVCLFVAVYFALFLIASVMLFSPLFRATLSTHAPAADFHSKEDLLYDDFQWGNSLFLNFSGLGSFTGPTRGLRWPLPSAGPINCSTLHEVSDLEFVAAGWTKAVYRGVFRGKQIAIKTVNLNGHDFLECQDSRRHADLPSCYRKSAAKILKELILLTQLEHVNIVKVEGSCVPDAVGPVVIATELGDPLDTVQLLQLSWLRRLQLVHDMARLLYHLAHSPLGSLAMNDLRRQQFVLVDGTLKLSDVDDMGVAEPLCQTHTDCVNHLVANISDSSVIRCEDGQCKGHNERLNIYRAGQHLVSQLLPLKAPTYLEPQIHLLLEAYGDTSWNAARILAATEQLLRAYSPPSTITEVIKYRELPDCDLPGQYDYWCPSSETMTDCTTTVTSHAEAVALCQEDWQCRAVVVRPCTYHSSHCEEMKVTLKRGFSNPSSRPGSIVLLKPS